MQDFKKYVFYSALKIKILPCIILFQLTILALEAGRGE